MSDTIEYLHDHLRCRQAVARDAGRSWVHARTPQALLRLEEAAMDATTAWHWYNRARWEAQ